MHLLGKQEIEGSNPSLGSNKTYEKEKYMANVIIRSLDEEEVRRAIDVCLERPGRHHLRSAVQGIVHLTSQLNIVGLRKTRIDLDGLIFADRTVNFFDCTDVSIRDVGFHVGDGIGREVNSVDALRLRGCKKILVDHCSMLWSIDEILNVYSGCENITVRNSVISEPLHDSLHEKGMHGMGTIIEGKAGSHLLFERNLLAHVPTRGPRISGEDEDATFHWINNVHYNWGKGRPTDDPNQGWSCGYAGGGACGLNLIGNYYKPGLDTPSGRKYIFYGGEETRLFANGNYVEGWPVDQNPVSWRGPQEVEPQPMPRVVQRGMLSAFGAYDYVLRFAGPRPRGRSVARIVEETRTGTGITKNTPPEGELD